MKPETLHRVTVRDVAAALESMDAMEMVQHHVNRLEVRRYLALTDQQYWRLMEFLKTTSPVAHSH